MSAQLKLPAQPLSQLIESDLIGDFMSLTEGDPSPPLFRKWAGIALVAGALERRVWVKAYRQFKTFPNLYTMLVAPPGVGKQVIDTVKDLWSQVLRPGTKQTAFHISPDQMSKASLIDALAKATQSFLPKSGPPIIYHSMLIAAEEFQSLLPSYEQDYIATLNKIFNNPEAPYKETRRTGSVREVAIELPQFNILCGAQPAYFVSTFPEEAWSTGLSRRIIMIYSGEKPYVELFAPPDDQYDGIRARVLQKLGLLSEWYGQVQWTKESALLMIEGDRLHWPPTPTHSKLAGYNNTRTQFVMKLAMVSSAARAKALTIDSQDVKRASEWLLDAERVMPDIFRAMVGKSDNQIIEELYYFISTSWLKNKQKPVNGESLWQFLSQRVPSEKIEKIMQVAEKSNVIQRVAGTTDLYLPRPRQDHGVE